MRGSTPLAAPWLPLGFCFKTRTGGQMSRHVHPYTSMYYYHYYYYYALLGQAIKDAGLRPGPPPLLRPAHSFSGL